MAPTFPAHTHAASAQTQAAATAATRSLTLTTEEIGNLAETQAESDVRDFRGQSYSTFCEVQKLLADEGHPPPEFTVEDRYVFVTVKGRQV